MRIASRIATAVIAVVTSAACASAQPDVASAALNGVAGAYFALDADPVALWYNPALAAGDRSDGAVELSWRRLFGLPDLEEVAGSGAVRLTPRFSLGTGIGYLGSPTLYQEFAGTMALAFQPADKWTLGFGVSYRSTEFGENVARYAGAAVALGAVWRPHRQWRASLALRDITLDKLYEDGDPPIAYDMAVAWNLPPDLTVAARLFTTADDVDRLSLGQMLRLSPYASFLSGLRFDPIRYTLGGRVHQKSLIIDYSYEGHPDLGGTHTVGMGWRW